MQSGIILSDTIGISRCEEAEIMNKVITISREYGSGGRELGVRLAEELGIPFYDKELISIAAQDGQFEKSILQINDEVGPDLTNYSSYTVAPHYQIAMSHQMFQLQSKVIKDLAAKGPCIIVGRCADSILKDSFHIFIYSDIQYRVQRKLEIDRDTPPAKMEEFIRSIDKKRKEYYEYYSGKMWGMAEHYHLCLDSGPVGVDGCLDTVLAYIKHIN